MPGDVRIGSRVRVVGNHHDRFLEILIQALQNLKHLGCRVAIEIACRFVSQQQGGIAHDCASNRDALFLTARELLR